MENLIRKVRTAAGMSQIDFAREIGRSLAMLRNYEHGQALPVDVFARLGEIAARIGRPDLMEQQDGSPPAPPRELPDRSRNPEHVRLHQLLDDILNSGKDDAIHAVTSNLVVFGNYVRSAGGKGGPKKGPK